MTLSTNHLQSEWVMRTTKKKKHQTAVTKGIDTIIPTSQTAPASQTATAPPSKPGGQRQPRGKGAVKYNTLVLYCPCFRGVVMIYDFSYSL